ncbi:MAG: ribonuclease HII [Eubacteriales bacterium]|nr:ribonuclease HII [Eubacteriales bacterium]
MSRRDELNRIRYEQMQKHELLARARGYTVIAGIDEAGRGPLAGPVVAAACILDHDHPIYGLNDSKKLTPASRNRLFQQLQTDSVAFAIGIVDAAAIDQLNILQATCQAMKEAIAGLKVVPQLVLIDAVELQGLDMPSWSIVRGDGVSNSIAAASILAKVTRDQMMEAFHQQYPDYGFDRHKGYGTEAHYQALFKYGPCPIHRRTFLHSVSDQLISSGHVDPAYFDE